MTQNEALTIMMKGENVFLTGAAGSGKTYVLNQFIKWAKGEAWYVNPEDGKWYYMKDEETAYQIMRFLSLGITNENLRKIPVGDL